MHLSVRHSQINGETAVPGSKSHTIRALAIADLAVSVNRKEMIRMMDQDSETFAKIIMETRQEFIRNGGKSILVPPFVMPGKNKS
jgi:5-enolpyruvylshikimate-3-phosphate synthase